MSSSTTQQTQSSLSSDTSMIENTGTTDSLLLISSAICISIESDIETVSNFFHHVFGFSIEHRSTPFSHVFIPIRKLSEEVIENDNSGILLIPRSLIPIQLLESVQVLASRHVFIAVPDPARIQKVAMQYGAQFQESNIDYDNTKVVNVNIDTMCVFEGPEQIMFYVLHKQSHLRMNGHDLLLNTLQSKLLSECDSGDKKVKSRKSPMRINIPSLKVEVMSNNKYISCPPNPRFPIPFETDYFKGVSFFVIRTNPIDPMYASFFQDEKKYFEVQIQGKFKQLPTGDLYCGIESSNKVELGLITRSISKAALSFFSKIIIGLQHSFGDSKSEPDFEEAHLVAPMFNAMDKIIVTKPGQTPPKVGEPFMEDQEYRHKRFKFRSLSECEVSLDNIYSLSVKATIDLIDWTLKGVPMMKPIDLHSFIGDSALQLVTYEVPPNVSVKYSSKHPKAKINYLFSVKLTEIQTDQLPNLNYNPETPDEIDEISEETLVSKFDRHSSISHIQSDNEEFDSSDSDVEGDHVQEVNDEPNSTNKKKNILGRLRDGDVTQWFRKRISNTNNNLLQSSKDIAELDTFSLPEHDWEVSGKDLRYCCASVETFLHENGKVKKVIAYILPWEKKSNETDEPSKVLVPRIRSYVELQKALKMLPIPKLHKNKRLSEDEKLRRQIMESYRHVVESGNKNVTYQTILEEPSTLDFNFLLQPSQVLHVPNSSVWRGACAFARSSRHWIERIMELSDRHIKFMKQKQNIFKATTNATSAANSVTNNNIAVKEAQIVIPLVSIISIRLLKRSNSPFIHLNSFYVFEIESITRVYYVLVRSETIVREWIQAFRSILGESIVQCDLLKQHDDDDEEEYSYNHEDMSSILHSSALDEGYYFGKPFGWYLQSRRVFNYRRILFVNSNIINSSQHSKRINIHESPTKLVEELLLKAIILSEIAEKHREANVSLWLEFCDHISLLQLVNVGKLSEQEKLSFFLNMYHLMILHGTIVLGPPMAWVNWQSFFNTVAYMVDGDIISIAELEQNVLRSAMSKSTMLFSKTVAPKSNFPTFSIQKRDFRLNFCINNGSYSMATCIPIYEAYSLDIQMDQMTSSLLSETVSIDVKKRVVILPKICSQYLQDFSLSNQGNHSASMIDCLRVIVSYLNPNDRQDLMKLLSEGQPPSVRFHNFNYKCRRFQLYQPSVDTT